jgi:hypothetical protein
MMKDRIEVVSLQPFHVREIIGRNLTENDALECSVSVDEQIKSYLSPGSAAYCLTVNKVAVVCGGIMNFGWQRGEAWILASSLFSRYLKTSYKTINKMLPGLASMYKFRRVQAVTWDSRGSNLFEHLGFKFEAKLKAYGPLGQDAFIFVRFF